MKKYITPYHFNTLDFTEASLINEPVLKKDSMIMEFFGITFLRKDFFGDNYLTEYTIAGNERDMFLSGICRFSFTEILEYSCERRDKAGFVSGNVIRLTDNACCESYGGIVIPPMTIHGNNELWYEMTVKSAAPIEISFDENSLVDVRDYCREPKKYTLDKILK